MIEFDSEPLSLEDGVMFGRVTIDGIDMRAGITLAAFERLIERAGYDPDRDLGQMRVRDILDLLEPTIEAHLQSKHFRERGGEKPLIIAMADLTTH